MIEYEIKTRKELRGKNVNMCTNRKKWRKIINEFFIFFSSLFLFSIIVYVEFGQKNSLHNSVCTLCNVKGISNIWTLEKWNGEELKAKGEYKFKNMLYVWWNYFVLNEIFTFTTFNNFITFSMDEMEMVEEWQKKFLFS